MLAQPTTTYPDDEGIFIPKQRYPLVIHFGGNNDTFKLLMDEASNITNEKQRAQALADIAKRPAITGYWFIGDESLGQDFAIGEGWKPFTRTNSDGTKSRGIATQNLLVAVCAMRRVREIKKQYKDEGLPNKQGWYVKMREEQRGKYQTRLQLLGIVWGLESLGAVVVTMKTNAVKQMLGDTREKNPGILNVLDAGVGADSLFYKHVIAPASKQAGKPIPFGHYWLSLEHAMDKQGIPVFDAIPYGDKGENVYVCPVVWHGIETTRDMLKLDDYGISLVDAIRHDPQTKEWAHAWDPNQLTALNSELDQDAGSGDEPDGGGWVPPAPPMEDEIPFGDDETPSVDENGEVLLPTQQEKKDPATIPGVVKGAQNLKSAPAVASALEERHAKFIAAIAKLQGEYVAKDKARLAQVPEAQRAETEQATKQARIEAIVHKLVNTTLNDRDLRDAFVREHFNTMTGDLEELSIAQLGAFISMLESPRTASYLTDWTALQTT